MTDETMMGDRTTRGSGPGKTIWLIALLLAALAVGSQVGPLFLPPRPIPPGVYPNATLMGFPTGVRVGTSLKFQLGNPSGAFTGKLTERTTLILSGRKVDMKAFADFVSTTSAMHTTVAAVRPGEITAISLAR